MGNKSKLVSALLACFLGGAGAHRYYLGYKKQGILQTSGAVSCLIGYGNYIAALVASVNSYDAFMGGLIVAIVFWAYWAVMGIWAFVDFIRIQTGGLCPADGLEYRENVPVQINNYSWQGSTGGAEDIEKLARLYEQGVLTSEDFQQKKREILARM